ncbi:MAG: hypothetical protein JWM40_930 [Frankiales bacterium]|nr:hypothetical protein [Frankiales bacterium]
MGRRRNDEGVTTVEFAIVFPLFIFLVGIATYFAWLFYVQAQVDRAANRAARFSAVPYTVPTTVSGNDPITGKPTSTTQQTTTYAFCVNKVVDEINGDLFTGKIASSDLELSDGSRNTDGTPVGPISSSAACAKPQGYVRVQIKHDFTNPFSFLIAPFTGTSTQLTITGTGRARVESQ